MKNSDSAAFIQIKNFNSYLICRQDEFSTEFKMILADLPNAMANDPIKTDHKTRISKVVLNGRPVIIKHYPIKNFFYGLKRTWVPSRAFHCWKSANLLLNYGIKTPKPIAMFEKRFGPFRRDAYFIYDYVAGETALEHLNNVEVLSNANKDLVHDLVKLISQLQNTSLSHGDFKAENFIVAKDGVYIIDLDAMRLHRCPRRLQQKQRKDFKRFMKNWVSNNLLQRCFLQQFKKRESKYATSWTLDQ